MIPNYSSIQEIEISSIDEFANIAAKGMPIIIRNAAHNWNAVKEAEKGIESIISYIKSFDRNKPASVFTAPYDADGKLFYNENLDGYNFKRNSVPINIALDEIYRASKDKSLGTISIQSTPIPEYLSGFEIENKLSFIPSLIPPRIWIGTALHTRTHYDLSYNIACVVSGKRRFIVFPPNATHNLYPGPLEFTLSGPPVSMVDPENPDLEKYPKFADAIKQGQMAELNPGDVIFIPFAWWHHVTSLSDFNVLVNYWWKENTIKAPNPLYAVFHAAIALQGATPQEREAWKAIFEQYVFNNPSEGLKHLPEKVLGVFGNLDNQTISELRKKLAQALLSE